MKFNIKNLFPLLFVLSFFVQSVSAQQTQLDPEVLKALEELRVQVENLKKIDSGIDEGEATIASPDLDVAELVLQQMMKQSIKFYFQTLIDIKKDIGRSLGKIVSLKEFSTPKSNELLTKVLQDEVNSIIPSLNQNINNRYQLAISYLVRLFGKVDFPVSSKFTGTKNVFKSKSIFYTNYEELFWNICQTKYCHAVISEKIAQWYEFSLAFNTDVDFLNIKHKKSVIISNSRVSSTPFVYLAMVDAAKETIEEFGLSRNREYSIPGALAEFVKDMVGLTKGAIIGVSAIPVGVLEETAISVNNLIAKKILVPELKLHSLPAFETSIVTKSFKEFMYEHSKKYENTKFSNEHVDSEKSNRVMVLNALERARRVTSKPLLGVSDELLYEKLEKKYNINYNYLVPYINRSRNPLSDKLSKAKTDVEKTGYLVYEYDDNGMLVSSKRSFIFDMNAHELEMMKENNQRKDRKIYLGIGGIIASGATFATGWLMHLNATSIATKELGLGLIATGISGWAVIIGCASVSSTDTIEEKVKKNPMLFTQIHPDVQDRIQKSRPDVVQKINEYIKSLNEFSNTVEKLKG